MEPIFTLQYGEYKVAEYLKKHLNKKGHKVLTVQVKMSRTYEDDKKELPYGLWFNRFDTHDNADWYMLVGNYCKNKKSLKANNTNWGTIILAFNNKEMNKFLKIVRLRNDDSKPDKFFGLRFDDDKNIILTRGSKIKKDMSKYLIENRIDEIIEKFN